jgi:GT2 family glycosyltransferase
MKIKVCIIILNWNGREFLKNCLNSIKKNVSFKNYKVIVVDNGSKDGSQNMIKKRFKEVDLIENKKNNGFSGGNNQGMKHALKKYDPCYVYLLNNDTLVEKNWLEEAIKCAESKKEIGIVGSKQLTFDRRPAISAGWIRLLGIKYYYGNQEKEVNWVSGAGFLIKKEVLEKIGFLDEIYNPVYYEETDLEKRAILAGFKVIHCPKSIFLHKGGVDVKSNKIPDKALFYRNRLIYFFRYYQRYIFS